MAAIFRTTVATIILAGLVLVGFWRLSVDQQRKIIEELSALNADMQRQLDERQAMIDRLSRSRRIAHVQVLDQRADSTGRIAETDVLFVELDEAGSELARQTFTVPGDVLFIDAWTVKFDHERIAQGDPLLGSTLVLLRRIYSDRMAPQDGLIIDTPGAIPPAYAAGEAGRFEQRIWQSFWQIATDADLARRMGVRVAQGEAVYKPVRAGQEYQLIADAAGGMSLTPLPAGQSGLTQVTR